MTGPFINDKGYEVPDNLILVIPHSTDNDGYWKEILEPLKGNPKRKWFTPHFYRCLPLNIGNQLGFGVKAIRDIELYWQGGESQVEIKYLNSDNEGKQFFSGHFGSGILTIQNSFFLKTTPGINLATIQPPNWFIPGCAAMTGVVETDNLRRDFTFNLKITVPNLKIFIQKGDLIGAFIPVKRYFVDDFDIKFVDEIFDPQLRKNESDSAVALGKERETVDKQKPNGVGRRYFNGIHIDNSEFLDHQKQIRKNKEGGN